MKKKIFAQMFMKPINEIDAIRQTVNVFANLEKKPWQISEVQVTNKSHPSIIEIVLYLEVEE